MGNWHISIQGLGQHHNSGDPKDANEMTKKFVKELEDAGHRLSYVTFTHGGVEDFSLVEKKE